MRRIVLVWMLLTTGTALGQPDVHPCPDPSPVWTRRQLLHLSRADLDRVYHEAAPPLAPGGFLRGSPIFFAGTRATGPAAAVSRLLWQGKLFRPEDGTQVNRLFGVVHAVRARVYPGDSWLDNNPALIMDYRQTRLFSAVRDEIREAAPGLYLGITFLRRPDGPRFGTYFLLEARPQRWRRPISPCSVGN